MIIKIQKFIKDAIKNGYDNIRCNGWDWIRENLEELDFIFKTDEYKKCNGIKYKCIPILLGKNSDEYEELEKGVLETAWYLNNKRNNVEAKKQKIEKLNSEGFYNIEDKKEYNGKKVEFILDSSDEIFGGLNKFVGKLVWSSVDKRIMVMKPKHRRRGYWINENIFVKFI